MTGGKIGFQSTKSGAGEQFPLLDFTAKARVQRVFLSQTPESGKVSDQRRRRTLAAGCDFCDFCDFCDPEPWVEEMVQYGCVRWCAPTRAHARCTHCVPLSPDAYRSSADRSSATQA